jgi:hypothetical protein
MTTQDRPKRAEEAARGTSEQKSSKDNAYGRSSAEATDLTREARQEARRDKALRRRATPPKAR